MKKRTYILSLLALTAAGLLITGCSSRAGREEQRGTQGETDRKRSQELNSTLVTPTEDITELEEGLSIVRYEGDYGFDGFLEQGGADSDEGVVSYVSSQIMENLPGLLFGGNPFGCSTLSVQGADGGNLFGRNFDWDTCNGLIISAKPENGYASVSTVNMDFIQAGGVDISKLPDRVQAAVGLYAPLDGMNEEGLAVSVNMIQDSETINQNTGKPDLTTTTAVRLLLDRAADVDEAVELLEQYDLHASMNMMVHFPLSDASGRSVVVEYVNNEMKVTETQAVTNFYLTEGEKYGIGTSQSHERYEILQQTLAEQESMTEAEVRDALDSVSKDNFGDEFSSTEWSIVMNQETKEMTYFHRENYENGYTVRVE
ncbi:MAG: C45 family peptidase [Blautia sp.]